MPVDAILAEVQRCAGTQFDPAVAAAFIRIAERDGLAWVVNSAQDVGLRQLHQWVSQKRMLLEA